MDAASIPNTSGIYKITCLATKKIYIGSTLSLLHRRNHHFHHLHQNKHPNSYLQRAWDKYGEDAFTFEVLEFVLPISLIAREQYWLNKLKPFGKRGYNMMHQAGSSLGRKLSPEHRARIGQANRGKKRTPEQIEKQRQTHPGQKWTPETHEKQRQSHLGRKMSPEAIAKRQQSRWGKKYTPNSL